MKTLNFGDKRAFSLVPFTKVLFPFTIFRFYYSNAKLDKI